MKNKGLLFFFCFIAVSIMMISCSKEIQPDDKNKIDIKGSMTNGDMRSPNIEAYMEGSTVWVRFYEDFGDCTVSIIRRDGSLVTCDSISTCPDVTWGYYMGDQPLNRYHLVISNGTDEAEGWFFNFRMAAVRPM